MSMQRHLVRLVAPLLLALHVAATAQVPDDPTRWLATYRELSEKVLGQQDKVAARREAELLLGRASARHGAESPEAAIAAAVLADALEALGEHGQSLPIRLRVLKIAERLVPDHPLTADVLNVVAKNYSVLDRRDQALPLYLRELRIREQTDGPDGLATALALNNVATTYFALGKYDQALPLQRRATQIYEKTLGPDHPDTANAHADLAWIYHALGDYEFSLPLQIRALRIREKAVGPDHLDVAIALGYLASTHSALGQYEQALPLQMRAIQIRENALGADHPETAVALNNLAQTYSALAQYDLALPLQQRVLKIMESAYGPEHSRTGLALGNLAVTHVELGQHEQALALQLRVLHINESTLGPDHPATATALNNLAGTYAVRSQHDFALPLQQRALLIFEKALGPEHPDTATAMLNLARTHAELAQHAQALRLELRALQIIENALGPDHPTTATILGNLAETYAALSQGDLALQFNIRALQILEKRLGPDHPKTAVASANVAASFYRAGLSDPALALLKSSVNAYQVNRERVSRLGADELRSYTASVSRVYQILASALAEQGRLAEAQVVLDMLKEDEQFDFIRRSSDADPRRTRIGYTTTEERWMKRYRQVADQLAALGREERELHKQARLGLTDEQKARQRALVADLKVAQAAFESFLNEMRQEFAAKGPARAVEFAESSVKALAELQGLLRSLGDDVVLLQVYLTDEQINFLLTTPGVQLARSVRVNQKDLNRQVLEYQRLLRDRKSDPLPAAQALYRLLLAPVAQDLEQAGAKTVMLSLDGVLRYLPFGSLHDGQRYAMQRWNLPVYTSVVRERLREANAPQWQAAGLGVTRRLGEFDALPAVRTEMSSIVRTGSSGVLPGEVHLDEAFTAQRLRDVSQRGFPVVHVASHFRFSPGTEINSFLLLGDGNRLTLGDIRTQNYRFDDVDLLTLSACETGLGGGRDERGQEIEGFGVIAQQQGAKAVLATLWRVADSSTAVLMGDMYRRRMEGGLTKIEALRQAQLAMASRPQTAHPFYWAPFILMGNWK